MWTVWHISQPGADLQNGKDFTRVEQLPSFLLHQKNLSYFTHILKFFMVPVNTSPSYVYNETKKVTNNSTINNNYISLYYIEDVSTEAVFGHGRTFV